MIAANQRDKRLTVCLVNDRLDHFLRAAIQKARDLLDRGRARRVHFLQRGVGSILQVFERPDLRAFEVRGVGAVLSLDQAVLPGVGGDHELVRGVAADRTGLRLDHDIRQAAPAEDRAVSVVHALIGFVKTALTLNAGVKRIGVFHQELAGSKDAAFGPGLAAELRLDLIKRDRELFVALDVRAGDFGDDLFVGGPEHGA